MSHSRTPTTTANGGDGPAEKTHSPDGGIRAMFGPLVSRRRRHEPDWRDIAQSLFYIVESIDDYLCTDLQRPDGSTCTVYSGPNRAQLMGGQPPEGADVAEEWLRMIHPDDRPAYDDHVRRLADGKASEALYRLRGYDGATRWLNARARPRQSDQGLLADGIVSDVTRRVEAESALAVAEQSLRDQLRLNEHQARHDHLTGLGNRRLLVADLEHLAAAATEDDPALLVVLDLDGFKGYNDTFGHPAGDALLVRLAGKLTAAVGPASRCYRMGGDEFCVLHRGREDSETVLAAISEALTEQGEGFTIDNSFGAIFMPEDASTPTEALQIADQRLYAQKRSRHARLGTSHDALLQALYERAPVLRDHATLVARLAQATGARLGVDADTLERVRQAALLHDIGKIAVPDSILDKPGPLTPDERGIIESHTVVGGRILAASPVLQPIASIVRSHHERWDGTGYPDGLLEIENSIEARIVAVCDAFSAITSHRPYRDARTPTEALAEIRRCSGTHFDPSVVDAFVGMVAEVGLAGVVRPNHCAS